MGLESLLRLLPYMCMDCGDFITTVTGSAARLVQSFHIWQKREQHAKP